MAAVETVVKKRGRLMTLSGDFFPYSDFPHKHQYWTGFYTTRPFYKRLDRIVQSHMRAADILYSLAASSVYDDGSWKRLMLHKLESGRQELALFQHHDAITGTSRKRVMMDYLKRYQYIKLDSQ